MPDGVARRLRQRANDLFAPEFAGAARSGSGESASLWANKSARNLQPKVDSLQLTFNFRQLRRTLRLA
jgi:hypothetical protein